MTLAYSQWLECAFRGDLSFAINAMQIFWICKLFRALLRVYKLMNVVEEQTCVALS